MKMLIDKVILNSFTNRVPYPNSYFDSLPPDKATKIEPRSYCYCEQSLCQDINTHFQQAKEMNEAFNSQPNAIASMLNGDEVIDQEEGEYFNDEEEAEQAHRRIRRRRDIGDFERHFNMSTENATQFCKSVIENSLGVKVCREVPNIDLARAERDCVFDLKASGNKEFASSIVTSVMTLCADKAYKNMSLYEKDDDGVLRPPKVITENLCPNECSNHGNCSNSTCICDKGYTAADCSMSINTIPELMGSELLKPKSNRAKRKVTPLVMDFNPNLPDIGQIVRKNLSFLHSSTFMKEVFPEESYLYDRLPGIERAFGPIATAWERNPHLVRVEVDHGTEITPNSHLELGGDGAYLGDAVVLIVHEGYHVTQVSKQARHFTTLFFWQCQLFQYLIVS
ncbi:predicted protein [Nematostella vectensis]|uniref:EGF-like domain-containing protein n=1 Tax=Nematostella vectensis TaxID=45351 RepID=A7T495_NEMVE|nr:predicted protein [Nematostella vectensis]|eukprot:XP_001621319.1 hypothetical protein NEMVEDRAFT_v1g222115 [Nematostella vectensis]